jgi:hypothetical protein
MLHQKHFHFIDTYKDEAFTTIKAVVKQVSVLFCKIKSFNNNNIKTAILGTSHIIRKVLQAET